MAISAGATRPADQITFAHNSERQFARLLDFYRVDWEYEPTAFPIEWDAAGQPTQHFRPDFYLPGSGLYIEITTLNQRLVTKKNRKVRRLRELYPDVHIKILYQRDYLSLLAKYGLEPPSQLAPDPPAVEGGPSLPEESAGAAPRAREGGEAAQGPVEGQVRGRVKPARETRGWGGEPATLGWGGEKVLGAGQGARVASRVAGERTREWTGGAVHRAAAAGRPRVVPDPTGAVPPLPADPELVRLAQVPLPAEIAQRRGPATAKRAG
jgi:hypothetical protein